MEINEFISETSKHKKLEKIQKTIENLDSKHHLQIAKILNKNNIKLTQNNNGIFVNLSTLSEDIIDLISKYLEFINNQEIYINKDENTKSELEKLFF